MPIYADVIARLDERSARIATDQMERQFTDGGSRAGTVTANAFGNTLSSGMATQARSAASTFMSGLTSGITAEAGQVTGALSTVTGAAGGMSSGVAAAGATAAAGIAAIGVAVYAAGQQLYGLGERYDAVMDGIAIRTGKLGSELDSLGESVSNVANRTAASLEDIADIGGRVSVAFDLSGAPLERLTKQIADLNRMTGEELNIREFGQTIRGFGEDSADATRDLDNIYAAATRTGIPIGELVGTLQNAGPAARSLGLNFSETAGLITTFETAGLDSNRMLGGLSSAAAKYADAGLNLNTAFADTITQIRGFIAAGDEAAAMDLANKVFGTRSAQTFIDAIRQGTLSVQSLNDGLGETQDSISEMDQATSDWSETWEKLKNKALDALEPIATKVFEILNAMGQFVLQEEPPPAPPPSPGQPLAGSGLLGGPATQGPLPNGGVQVPADSALPPALQTPTGPGLLDPRITAPVPNTTLPLGPPVPQPPPQDIAGALADKDSGKGPRLPDAPVLPYDTSLPPGFGNLPQTAELVNAENAWMDARHTLAEKQARVTQLEQDNNATEADKIKARNDVINARQAQDQAELRLYDTQNKRLREHVGQLNDLGAQLDSDFGISKGLAGIAENITKFVANLAVAPWEKQMNDIANAPGQAQGGYGLMGMLGAQGAFGPQYTAAGQAAAGGNGASALGPALLQPNGAIGYSGAAGGAYPGDQALLANVPAGRYGREFGGDLTKGLGDCSSAIEDLVNLMDGRPTGGASMATGNEAEWLQARGFQPGMGGPGDFRVGFNSGHTQATLPGGTPFNWGSDAAAARGGVGGTGADDPAFTSHYYRPTGGAPASAPSIDPFAASNTDPRLTNPPAPTGLPPNIIGGAGEGPIFGAGPSLGVGGGATPGGPGIPFGGGASPGGVGGPGAGPTRIGGGVGLEGSGKGGVGLSDGAMGMLTSAMGGLDLLAPGAGQAAQTATKLANRAIQFGGQAVGIGVQGAIDTFVPFGGSKLASSNWATRLIGGLAGSHPTLPNTAGPKQGQMTPDQAAAAGGAPGGQQAPPPPAGNTFNTTINGKDASDDSVAREAAFHWGASNQGPGM